MILLILINIAIIIFIYSKYYNFPKDINNINEKVEEKDSIIIGYINDVGVNNNFDLILAEIIDLNIKGYIKIEYGKEGFEKYDYTIKQNIDANSKKLNKYEILVLNFLFPCKIEITKMELEEKLNNTFKLYNIQNNEIKEVLNNYLIEENIIDKSKQKQLAKIRKMYIIISTLLILIIGVINIYNNSKIYLLLYIFEKVVSFILLLKASIYTNKGQILKYNIDNYKIKLENKEFLTNKNTMEEIVLNKEFANSIALHINTEAKKLFIDNKIIKEAKNISKNVMNKILIASFIILLLIILMSIIVLLLPTGVTVWLYIIMIIATACVADITLSKKK